MAEKTTGGSKRAYVRPAKPVNEMTPEERRRLAEELYDNMQRGKGKPTG